MSISHRIYIFLHEIYFIIYFRLFCKREDEKSEFFYFLVAKHILAASNGRKINKNIYTRVFKERNIKLRLFKIK